MIKIEDTEVMGLKKAIKSMRNASNSWDESTSYTYYPSSDENWNWSCCGNEPEFIIGESDMELAKHLIRTGSSDGEFLRMIHVQADVTAPLYWWREASICKIITLPNNCSTINQMRTIDLDYETLLSIYHQRKNDKLDEWVEFCKWITSLPYMKEFLELDNQTELREVEE